MLTCLIVCLSQGPLVSVCVCVCSCCAEKDKGDNRHRHTHARTGDTHKGQGEKKQQHTHGVSVRYCEAHVVSVCPIKGASLKSACCFECAETSAHIPPTDSETVASDWQLEKQLREPRLHNPLNMVFE